MGDWLYVRDIDSLEGINALHCDTRDFHCSLKEDWLDTKDGKNRAISRVFHNYAYQISESSLLTWLKEIETMSGGKGEWRCLLFDKVECDGWLKYIRCYRNPKDPTMFIVCNRDSIPILWELCREDKLDKEHLSFIEE